MFSYTANELTTIMKKKILIRYHGCVTMQKSKKGVGKSRNDETIFKAKQFVVQNFRHSEGLQYKRKYRPTRGTSCPVPATGGLDYKAL